METTRAIFFDLDDTLHDFKRASGEAMSEIYDKIAGKHGTDKAQLKDRYDELLRQAEEHAFMDGRSSTDYRLERFGQLLLTFGIRDQMFATELVHLYGVELEKRLALFPGIRTILERLGQKYELYLVTEGPSDAQQRSLEILGIKNHFKGIFISGELGKIKSTGELFRHAVEKSGYPPQEVTLIGDSYKRDVQGGLKAGLKVIWLNRKNEKIVGDSPAPQGEINSLDKLEDMLIATPAPILVLGHPRSGTNFVSAILSSHPLVNLLIEPFSQHSRFVLDYETAYWKREDFDPIFFHSALKELPAAREFLTSFKRWLYFDSGEVRTFKETAFFFQLEWLKEYLPGLKIIYIERDPRGVASSFKKSDLFNRWDYQNRFKALAKQAANCERFSEYLPLLEMACKGSWVDQLAAMWHVRTQETRRSLPLFDHIIFRYEDLVAEPETQFTRMLNFIGLQATEEVMNAIRERCRESRGGEFSTFRERVKVSAEWKKVLNIDEKRIVKKYIAPTGDIHHGKRARIVR